MDFDIGEYLRRQLSFARRRVDAVDRKRIEWWQTQIAEIDETRMAGARDKNMETLTRSDGSMREGR
jgi:hypothetical protein